MAFGSSVNGFATADSDMDLCVTAPSMEPVQLLSILADGLEKKGFGPVERRLTARIPIIKFVDSDSRIEVDICATNTLAARNSALLRTYSQCDLRTRVLGYALKSWYVFVHDKLARISFRFIQGSMSQLK